AGNAATATTDAADATTNAGGASADAAPKTKTYADRLADLKTAADEAAKKNQDLATAIVAVTDASIDSDEGNIGYKKQLDEAKDRVKKRAEIEKQLRELGGPSARTRELQGKGVSGTSDHTRDLQASLARESDPKKRARLQEQLNKSIVADERRSAKQRASISSQLSKSQAADAKKVADERKRLLDQLAELGKGIDINTEAGRQNKQMLLDLAASARSSAEKSIKNKESIKSVADTMAARRKDFLDMAKAFGVGADEANKLADKYGYTKKYVDDLAKSIGDVPKDEVAKLGVDATDANAAVDEAKTHLEGYYEVVNGVPTFRETTVTTPGLPEAKTEMDDYVEVVNGVPTSRKSKIEVERDEALRKLAEVRAVLAGIRDKTVSITAIYEIAGSQAALAAQNQRRLDQKGLDRRFGGAVPGYALGTLIGPGTGTSDSIRAIVAETGKALNVSAGEFLSTDSSRKRNQAALEAGNRGATLGVVRPGSAGGMSGDDVDRIGAAFARKMVDLLPKARLAVGVQDVQAAAMGR
ncbi:MAG TPA: hypothetical protein VGF17_16255, partial [Phytomonospora sp.]